MAVVLVLACGHLLTLIDATDPVPDPGPWALWPDPDVEPGDAMTCVVDQETSAIRQILGQS